MSNSYHSEAIAGRLYDSLHTNYSVFLDSEAQFQIHDLRLIVSRTELFVLVSLSFDMDHFFRYCRKVIWRVSGALENLQLRLNSIDQYDQFVISFFRL